MALDVKIVIGPQTSRTSREDAEAQLRNNRRFPKGASVDITEHEGRWVAAIASVKEAEFPPSEDDAPSDSPEPSDDAPSKDDSPSDDSSSEDSDDSPFPDKDDEESKDKKSEGGEKGEIAKLLHAVTTLLTALGINPEGGEGDSPVPGLDAPGPDGLPPEGIPGEPGPPAPHPHGGPDGKNHTVHERALKPGEAPPGATPIGSPAFSSVGDDHPWRDAIGVKRSFPVAAQIGEDSLAEVKAELDALAEGTGYEVKQLREDTVDGARVARALISR